MSMDDTCIFCKIVAGRSAGDIVYRDSQVTAFRDIHPVTPVHILIIPNDHIPSMIDTTENDESLIGHMAVVASHLARQEGLIDRGYRLVINTGPDSGQTVFHLHMHMIGGRHMPFRFE
jgi:histidine triad (HIT) family protein